MKPGTQIGYYQVVDAIAKGGMGAVYRARDRALDRDVALKFLLSPDDDTELKPEAMKRFKREARVTAKLRHPHIVAVLGAGAHDGRPFIVMDLVEGHTLTQEIAREGALPAARAARIAWKLAEALQYAHEQGVLHRDVKPDNVLINQAGEPVLTDFGVGKAMGRDTSITVTGEIAGTPIYMPPEQATARNDQIGPRSDVFALGGTLYEMLTGQPPVRGKRVMEILEQVLNTPPQPPVELNPDVDPDLARIALKCLEKDIDQRYPHAQQLADELRDVVRERGGAPEAGVAPDVAHQRFLVGLLVGLAVGGLLWAVISGLMVRVKLGGERAKVRQGALWLQESGEARLAAGQTEAALADLDHALELQPDLVSAQLARGQALLALGRHTEALAALDAVVELDPEQPAAYVVRARVHAATGERQRLMADLQRLEGLRYPELAALRAELLSQ